MPLQTSSPQPDARPALSRPPSPLGSAPPSPTGGAAATSDPAPSLGKVLAFTFGAAFLGAVVWGLIAAKVNLEIGYVAWGIGLAAGFAALVSNQGRHHGLLVVPSIAASLVGIVLGKFLGFYFIVIGSLGFTESVRFYWALKGLDYGALDAVFIALAVYTAWRVTRPRRVKA